MRSFYRMSEVNKRLNNLTQDPFFFKCSNLQNLKKEYSKDSSFCYDKILFYFASKCKYLQQLDLTKSYISALEFANLLNILDLSYTLDEREEEVSSLGNLEFLEKLDLGWCHIRPESLCKILQKIRRMRDLDLRKPSLWDDLKNSYPDLEIIDLSGNIITSRGIRALAECKKLRKLAMMKMDERCTIDKHSWRRLFSSYQRLEEVNLRNSDMIFNYDVYEGLTLCKNLRQLYLWDIFSFAILEQCPKLQTIYAMRNS
ncbi:Uncharacterized protein DBV15_03055 [Temnothorax longispinosus]|uniref:F-box/LRR-repeat protein 4 n=1 Tax=Temnothorax longispinosus TaxID=300112 RepID=A0A4S2KN25_9HYME|nr:Uncharacterized protein DBV15_03055 [Temnothorax longispinosus]